MISKPLKYICLSSYRCPCHPVGKPVSESTMKRHRAASNEERSIKGLPLLPKGPIYTHSKSRIEYNNHMRSSRVSSDAMEREDICLSIASVQTVQEAEIGEIAAPQGSIDHESGLQMTVEVSPPDREEQTGKVDDDSSEVDSVAMERDSEALDSRESDGNENSEGIEIALNYEGIEEQPIASYFSEFEEEDEHLLSSDEEDELSPTEQFRASAYLRFRAWAFEAKEWVQLFVDFGIQGTLMKRILYLIKAPISMITVKRNLQKYSGFETTPYKTCRPHMLIGRYIPDNEDGTAGRDDRVCDECVSRGTVPNWTSFDYFSILPRMKAWVGNQRSCSSLYGYYRAKLEEKVSNTAEESFYEDFFDGELYGKITESNGGLEAVKYDVFIAISCDGFQTFENQSYDCWPIVGIVLNLPPSQRFLIRNLLPLGFIKGPKQPVRVDTFFAPLLDEIRMINHGNGTRLRFWNGVYRAVRLHVVYVSADGPASQHLSGAVGGNGMACCRYCLFQGYYCSLSRHYYYPSRVIFRNDNRNRPVTRSYYDIHAPFMRMASQIHDTLQIIEDTAALTSNRREEIRKNSGIKRRTVLLQFPSIVPYESFPLDTMHLFMNITKDIMELFKGDNLKLKARGFSDEPFVLSTEAWKSIDVEIKEIGRGTSLSGFGASPRDSSKYKTWKAAECRDFLLYYALILFEGHLPSTYLRGLALLVRLLQLCVQPCLSMEELNEMDECAKGFVIHFEKKYYRYDPKRACLCKSTLHALIHLRRTVELCGPLVGCNQMWVERYIGEVKRHLNATNLAAESLSENAKNTESYKMFYAEHFTVSGNLQLGEEVIFADEDIALLTPCQEESLSDEFNARMGTKKLLMNHLKGVEGLSEEEASEAVGQDKIWSYGRLKFSCGEGTQVVGACKARRHRKTMKRADHYVAAEFDSTESEDGSLTTDVYYGRILKILRYEFCSQSWRCSRSLLLMDWAVRVQQNSLRQLFKPSTNCSSQPSIESATVILNSIGILEHKVPSVRNRRTYFLDPYREANSLLSTTRGSPDGTNRIFRGLLD